MNLRELTQEQAAILALVENGELTEDQVRDHLDMLDDDIKTKIENTLFVINRLESIEKSASDEIERISQIKKSAQTKKQNLKDWLNLNMTDGQSFEFDLFKVSKVKGREIASVTDESKLPARFIKVKESISVDKTQLLKDLKAGINVDGAEISIGKSSLRIK
ncbi:MAG: hypothetical protein Unbinned6284contig1001_4 [Prokaryotic dsDNA virus sp.]|nr:MAG: hypothetical protein Unbinned6284contig1001_4 [Prokaryotic dsDNA virus sp.]|tara:strand:- start:448 stop:933 length:486 start_codon:yes stop_codon:yes gene_type:complete